MSTITRTANFKAHTLIANREEFQGSNFSGEFTNGWFQRSGRLPNEFSEAFRAACNEGAYVVYSYVTSIAWWTESNGWFVPPVKYSPTTGRQMSYVRRAIA